MRSDPHKQESSAADDMEFLNQPMSTTSNRDKVTLKSATSLTARMEQSLEIPLEMDARLAADYRTSVESPVAAVEATTSPLLEESEEHVVVVSEFVMRQSTDSGSASDSGSEDIAARDDEGSSESEKSRTPMHILRRRRREARQKTLEKKLARVSAQKRFTRKNGVIYVHEDKWTQYQEFADNAHLYISSGSVSVEGPLVQGATNGRAEGEGGGQSTEEATTEAGDILSAAKTTIGILPPRLKIVNELLLEEMSRISVPGGYRTVDNEHVLLNHDQVAPYRSIIPSETAFRNRLKQLEEEFADIARQYPEHPAVLRTCDYLPAAAAYLLELPLKTAINAAIEDRIDRARILLDGFRALIHVLDTDLRDLVQSYRQIEAGTVEKLPFSHLWYLFPLGQEIVVKYPTYKAYRVLQVTGGRRSLEARKKDKGTGGRTISDLVIDCFYIDYDGKEFGAVPFTISIKPYDDVKSVTALPAYPIAYDKSARDGRPVLEYLIKRGKKFEELTKVSHRRYQGYTLREGEIFDTVDEVDSDVMIDFEMAYRNTQRRIPRPEFGGGVIMSPTVEDYEERHGPGLVYDDAELLAAKRSLWTRDNDLLRNHTRGTLHRDIYVLLPGRVYGYVLLSRNWYPLDISHVDIVPKVKPGENDGFQKLVLPNGHKEIVRALINTHARKLEADKSRYEFDVVKGKGKGLIILLHGAPGVGKTSTAECVAANAGKPLFPITCGDIGGDSAQEVEENLEKFFDLARKWDCVLLLDEADVFLSAREVGNIRQNSLVSVFLRVLEYYPGILILTTNRVGLFDEAVKSRVHCSLYYPKLDKDQTFQVWQMNIAALEDRNRDLDPKLRVHFDQGELEKYAKYHWKKGDASTRWNGRQIKNAFQTAVALADWDYLQLSSEQEVKGPALEPKHFKKVAKASKHFDKYLAKTRRDDEQLARERGARDDSFGIDPGTASEWDSSSEDDRPAKKAKSSSKRRKSESKSKSKSSEKNSKPRERKSKTKSQSKKKQAEPSSSSDSSKASDDADSSRSDASEESSDDDDDDDIADKQRSSSKKKQGKSKS
ncbi:uncharacterized protein Z520_08598 [Fonsecaea multimorphosa CBS 102226]|uniref:AAA+ ATPase domain-containing protein n=1 Tax=Fonsecaea multimorphosa CBS 102226 TaxID=1442371 RepID=A0A0D2H251_9EURO|nr:uncharacterized protein Z520_08598 [Fonsecaea multimorphosa CBS 102226]KIX95890.1 hypothetical protein Z520_08598 [Fonsecaea multimorphosa CBS 102226]OAL21621.1 hypothetical protein AYO22_08017 [Fonsecaea multimorphosa]